KLKSFKKPLRKLLYEKGNIHANVNRLRNDLDSIQTSLDVDPFNMSLREKEAASVKSRVSRNRIDVVTNSVGVVFENHKVQEAFVAHYEMFLGQACETCNFDFTNLFKVCLNDHDALNMVRDISIQEVKDAIFSMGDDKSPGPDGYTAAFFKEAWNIISNDVTDAVREFFRNGTLLKEINHTIIALIPKVKSPKRVNDYRPISCCNVLFKCISKIIANRIKNCLKTIISPNQSAFIPGRSITDNILLTQELMHNYHLDRGTPRCAFKVDIQKAYDTVLLASLRRRLDEFKRCFDLVPSSQEHGLLLHAINLWLIVRKKLKTQDLIPAWDVSDSLGGVCSLCKGVPNSHDHLFFECPFASGIWNRIKGMADLGSSAINVYDIIHNLLPFVKRRTTRSVIAKLVVAATAYYVWQERNWRLFKKGKRSSDQIVECILSTIRLKLLSCKLKKSKSGESLARLWDLPEAVFV
ncbi:RNA-directed DNA polymerase, eukaryota, reverse transcriptase zinc-binding domain protein, partial [Tanacetum coccineum]